MPPPPTVEPFDGRGGGPDPLHGGAVAAQPSVHPMHGDLRLVRHQVRVGAAQDHVRQPDVGRVGRRRPFLELAPGEGFVVVGADALQDVVPGHRRLDQDLPAPGTPPRPPRHLAEELEGALRGPEVREVDPHVGVHHAHEGHPGKIQPLGDHLGAQQDVHLVALDPSQDLLVRPLPRGRVHVHAGDPRPGEGLGDHPLDLLGPESPEVELRRPAPLAPRRGGLLVATVVAHHAAGGAVEGQGHGAVPAAPDVAALLTLDEGGIPPAIEEQDHLFLPGQPLVHRRAELRRQNGAAP